MRAAFWTAMFALLVCSPAATAHAAPRPPEWMTRILHDYNDDWGGHASVRDGHDLLALDLQEAYNKSLGQDVVVLRLSLNGGYDGDTTRPELKEVITFKANGKAVSKEFRTMDNAKFQGNFDAVAGPFPILKADGTRDEARFYVEGLLTFEGLGVKTGDSLSDFFVQGHAGNQAADHMVGGTTVGGIRNDNEPPTEQSEPASYRRTTYPLRGPVMYVKSSLDLDKIATRTGDNKTITWSITNTLGRVQNVSLSSDAPAGTKIAMHGPGYGENGIAFDLGPGLSTTVHVYVMSDPGAKSGPLRLTLTTSLGGRALHDVALTYGEGTAADGTGMPAGPSEPGTTPAPAAGLLLLLVAAAATARRRDR